MDMHQVIILDDDVNSGLPFYQSSKYDTSEFQHASSFSRFESDFSNRLSPHSPNNYDSPYLSPVTSQMMSNELPTPSEDQWRPSRKRARPSKKQMKDRVREFLTPVPSRRKSRAGRKPLSGVFGICRQDARWVVSYRDDSEYTRHRYFVFETEEEKNCQLILAKRFLWKVVRLGRKLNPRDGEGLEEFVRSYESDGTSEYLGVERSHGWNKDGPTFGNLDRLTDEPGAEVKFGLTEEREGKRRKIGTPIGDINSRVVCQIQDERRTTAKHFKLVDASSVFESPKQEKSEDALTCGVQPRSSDEDDRWLSTTSEAGKLDEEDSLTPDPQMYCRQYVPQYVQPYDPSSHYLSEWPRWNEPTCFTSPSALPFVEQDGCQTIWDNTGQGHMNSQWNQFYNSQWFMDPWGFQSYLYMPQVRKAGVPLSRIDPTYFYITRASYRCFSQTSPDGQLRFSYRFIKSLNIRSRRRPSPGSYTIFRLPPPPKVPQPPMDVQNTRSTEVVYEEGSNDEHKIINETRESTNSESDVKPIG